MELFSSLRLVNRKENKIEEEGKQECVKNGEEQSEIETNITNDEEIRKNRHP